MAKAKVTYECSACGDRKFKKFVRCMACKEYNTAVEVKEQTSTSTKHRSVPQAEHDVGKPTSLRNIKKYTHQKDKLHSDEFNHLFDGGIEKGSAILFAGDPGAGKSTAAAQICAHFSQSMPILYVSGEENINQAGDRIKRITRDVNDDNFMLMSETNIEVIMSEILRLKSRFVVIDSIQVMYSPSLDSSPGLVAQVRECGAILSSFAKKNDVTMLIIGHATKGGGIAGPMHLEHIVDTVMQIEVNQMDGVRIIRMIKNRFGPAPEIGVFHMNKFGLEDVENAVEFFLHKRDGNYAGTCIGVLLEGVRPLLAETQALVETSQYSSPSRESLGFPLKRLKIISGVLGQHASKDFAKLNVTASVVGGLSVKETEASLDLAVAISILSSLTQKPVPQDLVAIGEVTLTGEIFPVPSMDQRLKEIGKIGFKDAIVPYGQYKAKGVKSIPIRHISQLKKILENLS